MASISPRFGSNSRTKVLKSKTSELKNGKGTVLETVYNYPNRKEITFLAISDPDPDLLMDINKKFQFHHLAIEDCLSEFQRSKIEQYKDYLHIILQMPSYEKGLVTPAEISVFLSDSYLVLVHWNNSINLNNFIEGIIYNDEIKKECMEKGTGYLLYKILDLLVLNCFPLIDKIEKRVRILESKIFDENSQDDRNTVREIAKVRRDIMSFHRIIKPQIAVINGLERMKQKFIGDELELYFGDIADHVSKQWDIISDQNELTINLNSTNESLISVRANNVMKTLTMISVIMLPLTLISGIYGMNIRLPIAEQKHAFEIIAVFMLTTAISMLVFFKRKKWV